jgi:L-cystine uptake protein TcyP (sodium:dicarboxylate symporter family)
MSAVLMFAAISAITGLVLGFYCVLWRVIVIPNLIIAIVSAIVSLDQTFSFLAGFAFVFGCLSLNQLAYLIGAAIVVFSEDPKASLTGDQADDYPGESYQSHDAKGLSKHAPLARRADHKSG